MKPGETAALLRQAAAEQVGLPAAPTPEATRAALLRHLAAARFFPGAVDHEALLVLVGRPAGPTPLLLDRGTAAAQELRDEVEAFAADFFATPIEPRRETWRRLAAAAAGDDRLRTWLRQLEAGLAIDLGSIATADPLVGRLATDLGDLLVLESGDRAAASRTKVWALVGDPALKPRDRDRARRTLIRRHPAVAALAPGYLDQLALVDKASRRRLSGGWVGRRLKRYDLQGNRNWIWRVVVIGVLSSGVTQFMTRRDQQRESPARDSFPVAPARPAPVVHRPMPGSLAWIAQSAPVRRRVEAFLGRELARVGVTLRDDEMHRAVAGLFTEGGASPDLSDAVARMMLTGGWDPPMFAAAVAAIEEGLARAKVALSPEQVEVVARQTIQALGKARPPAAMPVPPVSSPPRDQP